MCAMQNESYSNFKTVLLILSNFSHHKLEKGSMNLMRVRDPVEER